MILVMGDLLITPSLALKHNDCVTEVSLDAVPVWFLHMQEVGN